MNEKVALVTGGAKGIGASCVRSLSEAGFQVAIHYRSNGEEADKLVAAVDGRGKTYQADLAEEGAAADLIKKVKTDMGAIHVLVNNAGMAIDQILPFAKPEDFDRLIAVNLKPVFLLSKYVAKVMMKQKEGRIINISSVVGHTRQYGTEHVCHYESGHHRFHQKHCFRFSKIWSVRQTVSLQVLSRPI